VALAKSRGLELSVGAALAANKTLACDPKASAPHCLSIAYVEAIDMLQVHVYAIDDYFLPNELFAAIMSNCKSLLSIALNS